MHERSLGGWASPASTAGKKQARGGSAVRDGNEAVPLATQQPSSVAMLRTLRWLPLIRKWAMTFASSMTSYLGRGPALLQTNLCATSSSKVTVRNSGEELGSAGLGSVGLGSVGPGSVGPGSVGSLAASWFTAAASLATGIEACMENGMPENIIEFDIGTKEIGTAVANGMHEAGMAGMLELPECLASIGSGACAAVVSPECIGEAAVVSPERVGEAAVVSPKHAGDLELKVMISAAGVGALVDADDELAAATSLPSSSSSDCKVIISPTPAA